MALLVLKVSERRLVGELSDSPARHQSVETGSGDNVGSNKKTIKEIIEQGS